MTDLGPFTSNWDRNLVPGPASDVFFDRNLPAPYTVGTDANISVATLTVSHGNQANFQLDDHVLRVLSRMEIDGGTASIVGDPGSQLEASAMVIGDAGTGRMDVLAGGRVISDSSISIGQSDGGEGRIEVSGVGSRIDAESVILGRVVGSYGRLGVGDDAELHVSDSLQLGYRGGDARMTVVRDGTVFVGGFTHVGRQARQGTGASSLVIYTGGAFTSLGSISVGVADSGADGTVIVADNGSQLSSDADLLVGRIGRGTLNVSGGGLVRSDNLVAGVEEATAVGALTVSDVGSRLEASAIVIGDVGTARMDVLAGGRVISDSLISIGESDGGEGRIEVSGVGSRIDAESVILGRVVGSYGRLGVGDDAELHVSDSLLLGYRGGDARMTVVRNGTVFVGRNTHVGRQARQGTGASSLEIYTGGTFTSVGSISLGVADSGADGTVIVADNGSQLSTDGDIFIGQVGRGTLSVRNGGFVDVEVLIAGDESTAVGTLEVHGPGSRLEAHAIGIGERGAGHAVVTAQAAVQTVSSIGVGNFGGAHGTLQVDGVSTSLSAGHRLDVGRNGATGEMTVSGGAFVSSSNSVFIGREAGSVGQLTINGAGSTLSTNAGVYLGELGGQATLTITNGRSVISSDIVDMGPSATLSLQQGLLRAGSMSNVAGGTFDFTGGGLQVEAFEGSLQQQGGRIVIGDPLGRMAINGDFEQTSGSLQIEVAGLQRGVEYDALDVVGSISLGSGTLELVSLSPYSDPGQAGDIDTFAIMLANDIVGSFDTVMYDGMALNATFVTSSTIRSYEDDGLFRIVEYGPQELMFSNYRALPGDANGDLVVDGSDFNIWNANKFMSGTDWTSGDFNGDGRTDGSDFGIWNAAKFSSVNLSAVPEPGAGTMVILTMCFWIATRGLCCDQAV